MQLALNIQNDAVAEKLLWFLEHFKNDGIERNTIEDLKIIQEARQERESIPLESFLEDH